ncbi:hypothetical protein Hdeb2414_s0957g00968171 [Helianthus debilis subsp. tardiflorus]
MALTTLGQPIRLFTADVYMFRNEALKGLHKISYPRPFQRFPFHFSLKDKIHQKKSNAISKPNLKQKEQKTAALKLMLIT